MLNLIDLTGKRILVAGASSGIGRQTSITLASLGAEIVLVARREKRLSEVLDELDGENHSRYIADLSELDSIDNLMEGIVRERGLLDGLVYASGVGTSMPLRQFKPEKVQAVFDINFFGFMETVRQATKRGRFSRGMRIVGVSSAASLRGDKSHSVYSASKAAMDGAVRCLAKELADKGVCINTVAPAMTATELYAKYLEKYGEDSGSNEEILRRQYLGIAETQDVANAIAFLISPAAKFITGITLPVDGGLSTN